MAREKQTATVRDLQQKVRDLSKLLSDRDLELAQAKSKISQLEADNRHTSQVAKDVKNMELDASRKLNASLTREAVLQRELAALIAALHITTRRS